MFEGVRAYQTADGAAIFRLHDHTRRLFDSAKILGMNIPFSMEEIDEAQKAAVSSNNLDHAYLRPMVFMDLRAWVFARTPKTRVIVAAWAWGSYMGEENMKRGIKVRTSSYTRHHVNITMTKAKANGNYMNSMLALQEALTGGADEALLLDPEGYVAEGSGENMFIVRDGVIYTPELTNCLDGITRKTILPLRKSTDIAVVEKRITRDEVLIADEAFFTGTAAEVTPIRELDSRPIGSGSRGPITEVLQSDYFDVVHGRNGKFSEWVTLVKGDRCQP